MAFGRGMHSVGLVQLRMPTHALEEKWHQVRVVFQGDPLERFAKRGGISITEIRGSLHPGNHHPNRRMSTARLADNGL